MKLVRVSTAFAAGLIIKMLLRVGNICEATINDSWIRGRITNTAVILILQGVKAWRMRYV